jgi:hypothetical protein
LLAKAMAPDASHHQSPPAATSNAAKSGANPEGQKRTSPSHSGRVHSPRSPSPPPALPSYAALVAKSAKQALGTTGGVPPPQSTQPTGLTAVAIAPPLFSVPAARSPRDEAESPRATPFVPYGSLTARTYPSSSSATASALGRKPLDPIMSIFGDVAGASELSHLMFEQPAGRSSAVAARSTAGATSSSLSVPSWPLRSGTDGSDSHRRPHPPTAATGMGFSRDALKAGAVLPRHRKEHAATAQSAKSAPLTTGPPGSTAKR